MARQIGYAPLRSVLPVRLRDGYGRDRAPAVLDALVIENDAAAGHRPARSRRPAALAGAQAGPAVNCSTATRCSSPRTSRWPVPGSPAASNGTSAPPATAAHTCAPLHAARVPAPDGGEMLRLWEWERLRDLPFQIDFWLPADSDFLYVGVRVRNPHDRTVPAYWWSNIAVPETERTRVLAPADAAWHFDYRRRLSHVPVPAGPPAEPAAGPRRPADMAAARTDITYTTRSEHAADYFFDIPADGRRWITALDGDGRGLVQTSTDRLRGRKLFLWGAGRGGRRWQEWLTEPGTGGYLEIQAGLARTQLEHLPMPAESAFSWLEAYGPLAADPALVHGEDWTAARDEAAGRLEAALPRATVDAAYAAWIAHADADPKEILATGSGWGALETERGRFDLPGTPFAPSTLGEAQKPWLELLLAGVFPRPTAGAAPGPCLVSPEWRDLLESADTYPGNEWFRDYHLGIAQWAAGDRAQAVRSWECSLAAHPSPWTLRALAVAETEDGEPERAARRIPGGVRLPGRDGAQPDRMARRRTGVGGGRSARAGPGGGARAAGRRSRRGRRPHPRPPGRGWHRAPGRSAGSACCGPGSPSPRANRRAPGPCSTRASPSTTCTKATRRSATPGTPSRRPCSPPRAPRPTTTSPSGPAVSTRCPPPTTSACARGHRRPDDDGGMRDRPRRPACAGQPAPALSSAARSPADSSPGRRRSRAKRLAVRRRASLTGVGTPNRRPSRTISPLR